MAGVAGFEGEAEKKQPLPPYLQQNCTYRIKKARTEKPISIQKRNEAVFRPRLARSATNKNAWTCPPSSAAEQDGDEPRAENKAARVKSTSSSLNLPPKEIGRACRPRVREGEESPEAIPLRRHGKRATGFPQKPMFLHLCDGRRTPSKR